MAKKSSRKAKSRSTKKAQKKVKAPKKKAKAPRRAKAKKISVPITTDVTVDKMTVVPSAAEEASVQVVEPVVKVTRPEPIEGKLDANIQAAAEAVQSVPSTATTAPEKKKSNWPMIIAVLLIVAFLIYMAYKYLM